MTTPGRRKMTKSYKVMISILMLFLIIVLALGTFYIDYLKNKEHKEIRYYQSRRDELILQEQRLKGVIDGLNSTLSDSISANLELSAQLSEAEQKQADITPVVQTSPPPPPVVVTPRPRVTRAS